MTADFFAAYLKAGFRPGVRPQMIRDAVFCHRARILNRDRNVNTLPQNESKIVYWHRDEVWDRCYHELMTRTQERLVQEVARLGGHYAHVHEESIDTRRDDASGEAWLHGCFSYMLYRRP